MKTSLLLLFAAVGLAAGCAHPPPAILLPHGPGEAGPRPTAAAVNAATALESAPSPQSLPDRISLPAEYRLVLLDGNLVLLRESGAGSVVRLRASEAPDPVAAASSRDASASPGPVEDRRVEAALQAVMRRSAELEQQAETLAGESARIAATLASTVAQKAAPEHP
jgi:uncharacterized membrane protein YccC